MGAQLGSSVAFCSGVGQALPGVLRKARELELELIQSHMAQKPMLRGEVGRAKPQLPQYRIKSQKCFLLGIGIWGAVRV